MSTFLKSALIPSYFLPKLFGRPVLLDDIIEIRDEGVAAKLLSKVKDENADKPKPYFVEVTKEEYQAFLASKGKPTTRPAVAEDEASNNEAPVDPTTRVSSEGEPVLTKEADDAAKAEETAKAALVNTLKEVAKSTAKAPAEAPAKAPAKKVTRKAPAKPQRKPATK